MAIFSQRISATNQDGTWAGSWSPNGASWLLVGWNTFVTHEHYSGLQFRTVTIPKNAVINSASIVLISNQTDSNTVNTKMVGIAEDNTSDMSTDPIGRTETSANNVQNIGGTTLNNPYTWDVTSIVQEIVNRAGWGSGNNMGFKLRNNSGTGSNIALHFTSRQQDSTKAAILTVDYTDPIGTHSITKALQYAVRKNNAIQKMLRYSIRDMEASPVSFHGLKVAKAGHNALNTNKPESFNFHSNYGTLKYFLEGHVSINVDENTKGNLYNQFTFITHSLGYFPFAIVYGKTNLMTDYQPLGRFQAGSGASQSIYYYMTNSRLYMGVKGFWLTTPQVYTADFYYKIFRNNLGF